jgi:hypothetical protein
MEAPSTRSATARREQNSRNLDIARPVKDAFNFVANQRDEPTSSVSRVLKAADTCSFTNKPLQDFATVNLKEPAGPFAYVGGRRSSIFDTSISGHGAAS